MTWHTALKQAADGSAEPMRPDGTPMPMTISARKLQLATFPPVCWIVRDLIPEGVTLLAGKPKLGKSWLALQLGYAVASGSDVLGRPVTEGSVLYGALEDNNRRLKARLEKMSGPFAEWPERYHLATEWPRLDQGGLDDLERWIDVHADIRLVILDTLATIRPSGNARDSQYQSDYEAVRGLHGLANERGIAIVIIHHVRKADADDPFDTVSGSTGLTGAADATLVLTKTSDGKVLYGRGRDLMEFESALSFDPETCRWSDLGRPSDAYGSDTRKAIREALKAGKETPREIAEYGEIDHELCSKTLQRMAQSDEVQKSGYGRYQLAPDPLAP
jgi:hypothetical protein